MHLDTLVSIVSIQADQSRPSSASITFLVINSPRFNRINSGRSIPTMITHSCMMRVSGSVSIVSIQADQSRQVNKKLNLKLAALFQSYQFRQINPDWNIIPSSLWVSSNVSIVSIQADQSRLNSKLLHLMHHRMVSIVSIQADQSRQKMSYKDNFQFEWVSIVSIQADQSRPRSRSNKAYWNHSVSIVSIQADQSRLLHGSTHLILKINSFNRINSGRSIPTRW